MYYNIKIKCDGCEFCLDSNNKVIIESEMDKYFAVMFGASQEFKSHLKDVKIIDTNVKSIEDFKNDETKNAEIENCNQEYQKVVLDDDCVEFSDEAPVIESAIEVPCCEDVSSKVNNTDNNSIETPVSTELTPSLNSEIPSINENTSLEEIIVSEPLPSAVESTDVFFDSIDKNTSDKNIDDLIEMVEKEIDAVDITDVSNVDDVLVDKNNVSKINTFTSEEDLVFDKNDVLQVELPCKDVENQDVNFTAVQEDVNEIDNHDIDKNETNEVKKINDNQNDCEQISIDNLIALNMNNNSDTVEINRCDNLNEQTSFEDINQAKLDDIFSSNTDNDIEKDVVANTLLDEININPIPSYKEYLENINEENNKSSDIENSTKNSVEQNEDKKMDFKYFLAGFRTTEIIDEFLICSYYIKNILHQNCFSMKFINSNIYKATGEIANMEVVDKLIDLGYVKTVEIEGMKKYTITADGEAYFASKFNS